jgi:4-amino-4-deoxy-L-arabinose transferase-like glycosyltransferase
VSDVAQTHGGRILMSGSAGFLLGFVLLGFVAVQPFLADGRPTWAEHARTWLLRIVPGAWAVAAAVHLFPAVSGDVRPTTGFSAASSGVTHVPFADLAESLSFTHVYLPWGSRSQALLLWPVAVAVLFVLLLPALARPLAARPGPTIAIVGSVGLAFRVGLAVLGIRSALPFGSLPAQLDALAAGMALAALAARRRTAHGGRLAWLRARSAMPVGVVAALALLVTSALVAPGVTGARGLLRHVVLLGGVLALAAPILVGRASRDGSRRLLVPPGTVIGVSYAFLLWTPVVVLRWVSSPSGSGPDALTSRHPGQVGHVGLLATLVWTLLVTKVVAWVGWFAIQRPWLRYEHRKMSRFSVGLWLVGLASFASRLWAFSGPTARNPGNGDPFYYHAQANMLADRVGFGEPIQWITEHRFVPTAIHPPLFTLWLTPSSLLGARGFLSHKVMAAIAGVAVVVVAGLLAKRLAGERAGIVAAALVALSPDLWIVDGTLWPEGMYTAVVGLALIGAYRWRDRPTFGRAAAVGAAVGAAILTRGEAIFLLPILCLPLAWTRRKEVGRWLAHAAVMAGIALAVLAPWTIRNLATFDHVVPVSTNSEEVLYYANCPDVYRGPLIGWWSFNCQERARAANIAAGRPKDPPGDESARAAGWGKLGRQYAMDHKDRWAAVAFARITRVWDLQRADTTARLLTFEGRPYRWSEDGLLVYRLTLLPGLAGLVVLWRRRRDPVWPLVAMIAMVTLTAVSVYGHIRFRTVGDLVLLVGAGIAVDAVLPGRRAPDPDPEPGPT